MDRIKIKETDLELSRLGLGCVKAGVKWDGQEAFDFLGYLTCQKFICLPLYGPRNIADLKDAMETFKIPFRREDYPQK